MRAIWRVFRKEFRETLRDRRSLFTTLVIGPLLMPALITVALERASRAVEHRSGAARTTGAAAAIPPASTAAASGAVSPASCPASSTSSALTITVA